MSVVDFLGCISEPTPIEVNVHGARSVYTYVGCPTNWDAFLKHLSGFSNVEVFNVHANGLKLIVDALM